MCASSRYGLLSVLLATLMSPALAMNTIAPKNLADLEAYITNAEANFDDITPGAEKIITWANGTKAQTPYSVVYLHGYSATRQETAPFTDELAQQLGANAFHTRLTGHGRPGAALLEGSVEAWTRDTREAYEIGTLLGERVIVVSVSTGGTLATWLAAQDFVTKLAAMVMISPNFDLPDQGAYRLDWPMGIGVKLGEWLMGEERYWEPSNDQHAKYWTYRYPLAALRPLIQLLKVVKAIDKSQINTPTLFVYAPNDQVILPSAVVAAHDAFGSKTKRLIGYTRSKDPSQHVLVGDILSPESTPEMVQLAVEFLATALD